MPEGRGFTAHLVNLPERLARLPYLGEFYGNVAWAVRSIYADYVGWFDGNPTHLNPLSMKGRAQQTIALMGGVDSVMASIGQALEERDAPWALELADLVLAVEPSNKQATHYKAQGLLLLAPQETSAGGRNYYLSCARELLAHL